MYLPPVPNTNARHLKLAASIALVAWLALSIQFTPWRFLDGKRTSTLAGLAAGLTVALLIAGVARYRRARSES